MSPNPTRRQVLASSAAALGGLATAGTATASHTTVVSIGIYQEDDGGLSDVPSEAFDLAVEAINEMAAQIPNAYFDVARHPDTARVTPDYDDREETVRAFENELEENTDHLETHDICLFLFRDPFPDDDEMAGAGFNVWQWGDPDPHLGDTDHLSDSFSRSSGASNYAFAFVNVATGALYYDYPFASGDSERLYKNTVIHEIGHTFNLNHGAEKSYVNRSTTPPTTIEYEYSGAVVDDDGTDKATPMATWYADDVLGSKDKDDSLFCGAIPDEDITEHTEQLSSCSRAEMVDWIDRYGAPRVDGVRPTDVDGDGDYMDVNGDGSVTNSDVTKMFSEQHVDPMDSHPEYFDFDGDGNVGQSDVMELFESL